MRRPSFDLESFCSVLIVSAILALTLGGITQIVAHADQAAPNALRVLEQAGYTQIQPTGYRFFGCADNDLFREGFRALGPNGKPVSGVACSAPLKGHTIRLD